MSDLSGPVYRAIADALEADVRRGALSSGDPLPTQRDLAESLGVNFTTVTRAYDEARRRGLITARVGRGTFVAGPGSAERAIAPTNGARDLDLCVNQGPSLGWLSDVMRESLARIGGDPAAVRSFLSYDSQRNVSTTAREAGVRWLARRGVASTPERIAIAGGAQHALSMLLATRAQPGDVVVTEALSYPGFRSAAALARVRLVPVAMDADGIDPDALDAVCRRHSPRLMFCVPTLQNPTTAIMPIERREAIVEVARRHALGIIEDDVYGPLVDAPPSLATLAPERVTYLGSLSKSVAPGLRTAFVLTPTAADADELSAAVRASILMLSSIPVSLAAAWIDDGTAERVLADLRGEMSARSALARRILGDYDIAAPTGTLHAWLRLPPSWSVAAFVAQAAQRGVRIAPSDWYVTPSSDETTPTVAPQAVRLALGWEQERARVGDALSRLAAILDAPGALQPSSL